MEAQELLTPGEINEPNDTTQASGGLSAHESVPSEQAGARVSMDKKEIYRDYRWYWVGRRTQDIILSLVALLVLWPVMLLIALIVWLEYPGASPIFSQTRIGRNGVPFTFRKFRTMVPDAEKKLDGLLDRNEMTGPVFKIKDDPRSTPVGRFLRKSSLDELPQLFNVLRGEMSIVGPRPALPREVEQYDEYDRQRLIIQPGLTCYWQIQPHRNELSFEQWVELDLKYIRERSFLTDWKIILKTVGAVLRMTGV